MNPSKGNNALRTKETKMKTETFADGSTIDTDEVTGNRTVCGKLAHDEYFKRLKSEQIGAKTPYAIMEYCMNPDGTRKCELIRKLRTNPISIEMFGPYSWELWEDSDPGMITCQRDEESARKAFKAAMLHGTNGMAGAK